MVIFSVTVWAHNHRQGDRRTNVFITCQYGSKGCVSRLHIAAFYEKGDISSLTKQKRCCYTINAKIGAIPYFSGLKICHVQSKYFE